MLPLDVLTWQAAVASAAGPKGYTMRLVLLALGQRMQAASAFAVRIRITHMELAAACDLSRRWVILQIERAEQEGWLTISRPIKTQVRRMPSCEYTIRLPEVSRGTKCAHDAEQQAGAG